MGNENSTPAAVGNAFANHSAFTFNAPRKFLLPTEIWFEIFAFVKFDEALNIFLVNRYLLQICQVYFHSGTVGLNKKGNVRDLTMQLKKGSFTISVYRNGTRQSVPVPEVNPPKIFNAFGNIFVGKCCEIHVMQFLHKFQSLLTDNNEIICWSSFFVNDDTANIRLWFWKCGNSHPFSGVLVYERQSFLNLIGQKKLFLRILNTLSAERVARCLADEPQLACFNGNLSIEFKNERNLCGLEEDAKLIYGWISSAGSRQLEIYHYDAQNARELARQIVLLFEQAHINKTETEKINLKILLPSETVVPKHMQKVCNGFGDQLATLRTLSFKCSKGIYEKSAYVFYTKPLEYYYKNKEEMELPYRKAVYFS